MIENVGGIDRIARIVIGLVLIAFAIAALVWLERRRPRLVEQAGLPVDVGQ